MTTYVSVTDTAKLVRKHLKAEFGPVKFSVRSHKYAGGASLDVYWTDGPTVTNVKAITGIYQGASFDGMTDSKHYHRALVVLDGDEMPSEVKFGPDFIFEHRSHSEQMLAHARTLLAPQAQTGCVCDRCRLVIRSEHGFEWSDDGRPMLFCSRDCGATAVAASLDGSSLHRLNN